MRRFKGPVAHSGIQAQLKCKIAELERRLDERDDKIRQLKRELEEAIDTIVYLRDKAIYLRDDA